MTTKNGLSRAIRQEFPCHARWEKTFVRGMPFTGRPLAGIATPQFCVSGHTLELSFVLIKNANASHCVQRRSALLMLPKPVGASCWTSQLQRHWESLSGKYCCLTNKLRKSDATLQAAQLFFSFVLVSEIDIALVFLYTTYFLCIGTVVSIIVRQYR